MADMIEQSVTERKKKIVLLSFVGFTDPWSTRDTTENDKEELLQLIDIDSTMLYPGASSREESWKKEGAILGLCDCDELHPDILYMFPSCAAKNHHRKSNSEWRANWIENILAERMPKLECHTLPLDVQDATNFEELSEAFEKKLDELKKLETDEYDYEYHLNCTSGTQQMTAVGYVLANSGALPNIRLWQCKDPARLREGENRVKAVNASFIEENVCKKRIASAMDRLDFISVREAYQKLGSLPVTERKRDISIFLRKIFNAYAYMDMLRYGSAYSTMHDALQAPGYNYLDDERKGLLRKQHKMLELLRASGEKESPENLTDLYFNMQRCFKRGAYADVLARFWRITEGSVYHRLENRYEINPRDLWNGPQTKKGMANLELLKNVPKGRYQKRYPKQFIGLENGRYALLHVLDDPLAENVEFVTFFEQDVKDMTNERNGTIIAHGMGDVSGDDAEKCLRYAERILCTLVPSAEKEIRRYPFKEDDIMTLTSLL